jgi:hypothetical protein
MRQFSKCGLGCLTRKDINEEYTDKSKRLFTQNVLLIRFFSQLFIKLCIIGFQSYNL